MSLNILQFCTLNIFLNIQQTSLHRQNSYTTTITIPKVNPWHSENDFHIFWIFLSLLYFIAAMNSMETQKQGKPNRKFSIFFIISRKFTSGSTIKLWQFRALREWIFPKKSSFGTPWGSIPLCLEIKLFNYFKLKHSESVPAIPCMLKWVSFFLTNQNHFNTNHLL